MSNQIEPKRISEYKFSENCFLNPQSSLSEAPIVTDLIKRRPTNLPGNDRVPSALISRRNQSRDHKLGESPVINKCFSNSVVLDTVLMQPNCFITVLKNRMFHTHSDLNRKHFQAEDFILESLEFHIQKTFIAL